MTRPEFDELVHKRLNAMSLGLTFKGQEYADDIAGNEDRLYNFKRTAATLNINSAEALLGMMSKHLVYVIDMAQGKYDKAHHHLAKERVGEIIDEKIGDTINYLVLLEALLKEEAGLI